MRITEPGEYAVLGLLVEQRQHGYALARQFASGTELRQVVRLAMSQLYATLKKLETLGLIATAPTALPAESPLHEPSGDEEAATATTEPHRGRRVYAATDAGRHLFEAWLTAPVERPRDLRLMFLVKLFFALRRSAADVLALLDQQDRTLAAFHDQLAQQLAQQIAAAQRAEAESWPGAGGTRYATLVLRARLRQTEAAQTWLNDVREELGAVSGQPPQYDE